MPMKEQITTLAKQIIDLYANDLKSATGLEYVFNSMSYENVLEATVNSIIQFGQQVEQITKEKCVESAMLNLEHWDAENSKFVSTYTYEQAKRFESWQGTVACGTNITIDKNSILNTPSIFETH